MDLIKNWNKVIFLEQAALIAGVAVATTILEADSQLAVSVGLISAVFFAALSMTIVSAHERALIFGLQMSNACGIFAALCVVLAVIYRDDISNILYVGGVLFFCAAVVLAFSIAEDARKFGATGPLAALVLLAAPLGIGMIAGEVLDREKRQ